MKAFVDQDGCIGCGLCATTCPAVFAMNGNGVAEVLTEDVPVGAESTAADARAGCPAMVITVE